MINGRAIEFFSGMGSFAEACRDYDLHIVAAFDQDECANNVYQHNFHLRPSNSTLDSIKVHQIPDAEIWWLSPPCTPYSVRGKRADLDDPRAKSLLRLMQFVEIKMPDVIFLENVAGFQQSKAKQLVCETLSELNYEVVDLNLCSTDFGTPMQRPRYFLMATRSMGVRNTSFEIRQQVFPVSHYLEHSLDTALVMDELEFKKYEPVLNVISASNHLAKCICFTKNYYRCRTASGSLLLLEDGNVRRFSSREILRLLGFSDEYSFPTGVSEKHAAGLLGNAVDIRMIKCLLKTIVAPCLKEPLST